ncbi:3069_t:CDS:2, partial [Racocetra persica]
VSKPNLGENKPSQVKADVKKTNFSHDGTADKYRDDLPFRSHFGLKYVRGCEIIEIIGGDGKPIEEVSKPNVEEKTKISGNTRTLRVLLDTNQYK